MLPAFQSRQFAHHGGVNRVRSQPQAPHVVATWAETGHVQVWDIKSQLQALNGEAGTLPGPAKLVRLPLSTQPSHDATIQLQSVDTATAAYDILPQATPSHPQ